MSLVQGRRMSDYDRGHWYFRMGEALPKTAPRAMVDGWNSARKNALALNQAAMQHARALMKEGKPCPPWMRRVLDTARTMPEYREYSCRDARQEAEFKANEIDRKARANVRTLRQMSEERQDKMDRYAEMMRSK